MLLVEVYDESLYKSSPGTNNVAHPANTDGITDKNSFDMLGPMSLLTPALVFLKPKTLLRP